ncbi:hypothetical protein BDV19DRAFT_389590 [Aspergillus venezuelensis]
MNNSENGQAIDDDRNDGEEEQGAPQDLQRARQRAALRQQNMALSKPHIRPLTLVSLPVKLLYDRRESQKIIQNVRLVCREFNEVVSPLLCPVLQVDLDQASLDRAVNLFYTPLVASGIHAIRVGLQCFPEELARDPERFMELRLRKVRRAVDEIEYRYDEPSADEQGSGDDTGAQGQNQLYSEALNRGHKIWSSWDDYINRARTEPAPIHGDDEYQEILRIGYEMFCLKHHQQLQILESHSFVRTLVLCMLRMPNALSLGFSDEVKDHPPQYSYDPDLLVDNEVLFRIITAPRSWQELEYTEDMHLATARILSELPIAIHQAGVRLTDMYVGIFPCIRDQTLVFSRPHDPTLWDGLRADFGDSLNCIPIRHSHLGRDDSLHLNEYLAALLGSPKLEIITIHTAAFALDDGRGRQSEYNLSPVLAAAKWPCIRSLKSVSITQSALEALFSGLGCSVEYLQLSSFELLDGRWAEALDILRDKVRPHATIYFTSSRGGEFGVRIGRPRKSWYDWNYSIPETPPISGEVVRYISGEEMNNPLKNQKTIGAFMTSAGL